MAEAQDPKFYNLEEVEDIAAEYLPKPVSPQCNSYRPETLSKHTK